MGAGFTFDIGHWSVDQVGQVLNPDVISGP